MSRVRRSSRRLPFPDLPMRKDRRMQWAVAITITMLLAAGYATYLSARRAALPETKKKEQPSLPVKPASVIGPVAPVETPIITPPVDVADKTPATPAPDPHSATAMDRFRKAQTVMREFMAVQPAGDIHPLIRHANEVGRKAADWNRTRTAIQGPVKLGPQFGVIENFIVTQVTLADGSQRMAVFEEEGGAMRLDWESFVGYGEVAFDDLSALPPGQTALIRASVNRQTPMENDLLRFRLEHPSEASAITVSAAREDLAATPGGRKLASTGRGYYTLRLARAPHEKGTPASIQIARVESYGWVPELAAREMMAR